MGDAHYLPQPALPEVSGRLAMNGGSVRFVGLFERSAPWQRAQ